MKVGDTVKLKPAMWQWIRPEAYGLSFTGEYIVSTVYDDQGYPSLRIEGIAGTFDVEAFQLIKEKEVGFKFKVGDVVYLSELGVKEFAVNYWDGYHLPLAIYEGCKTTVEYSEKLDWEDDVRVHVNVQDHGVCFFYEDHLELTQYKVEQNITKAEEYTGGSSNYYKVFVKNPTTLDKPYEAECNDIIEALDMTFAEGNAFKAIWRKAKARQGVQKKGYDNGLYDSEKVVFFGERMVVEAKEKGDDTK